MSNVLERIAARQKDRASSAAVAWQRTVVEIGDGRDVKPEAVEALLADIGRTLEELGAAVKMYQRRKVLAAQIAAAGKTGEEREKLQRTKEAATRAYQKAHQEFADAINPADARLAELDAIESTGRSAREVLIGACPYTHLQDELGQVQHKLQVARQEQWRLRQIISGHPRLIESDMSAAETTGNMNHKETWSSEAKRRKAELEYAEVEEPGLSKQVAALEAEESRVMNEMCKP